MKIAFAAILICFASGLDKATDQSDTSPQPSFDPTSQYVEQKIEGWTLLVNKELLAKSETSKKVLREIENQLYQIKRMVPTAAVKKIQTIKIWVELKSENICAAYHPSKQWLANHNYNPEMAKCVQLGNANNFLNWTKHQPWMVLHELAHAYHDQFLSWNNKQVISAYKKAKAEGKYDKILVWNGKQKIHYAMNNHKEYFSECSEAYFGTNDMFPFVRAELKQHDPQMYKLLEKLWGVKK